MVRVIYLGCMIIALSFLCTSPWIIIGGITNIREKKKEGLRLDSASIMKQVFAMIEIILISSFVSFYCGMQLFIMG